MLENQWTLFRVRMDFITQLCASVPANPEVVQKWLDSVKPTHQPPGGRSIEEINEEVFSTLPTLEEPEKSLLIFQRNPTNGANLVVRAATIRAHMKDCARIISKSIGKIEKEDTFSVKILNYVYHDEKQYWLPILRPDGSLIMAPDGQRDKMIHARTARGPISALKTIEFIYPARIDFTLKVFNKLWGSEYRPIVPQKDLETLFMYGGTHGYAGERSDGEGRYTVVLNQVEEKENAKERTAEKTIANSRRNSVSV